MWPNSMRRPAFAIKAAATACRNSTLARVPLLRSKLASAATSAVVESGEPVIDLVPFESARQVRLCRCVQGPIWYRVHGKAQAKEREAETYEACWSRFYHSGGSNGLCEGLPRLGSDVNSSDLGPGPFTACVACFCPNPKRISPPSGPTTMLAWVVRRWVLCLGIEPSSGAFETQLQTHKGLRTGSGTGSTDASDRFNGIRPEFGRRFRHSRRLLGGCGE